MPHPQPKDASIVPHPISINLRRGPMICRGEGGGVGKGGPLWSPVGVGQCVRATETGQRRRATIKDFAGECEKYAMAPVHRATARDRPYYRRPGKPTHSCIVGAGLAPALPALHSFFHSPAVIHALVRTRAHENDLPHPYFHSRVSRPSPPLLTSSPLAGKWL